MRIWISGFAVLMLAGCASTMPAPDNMHVTSLLADPTKCVYKGDVRGDENLYGGTQMYGLAEQSANSKIMQAAAKLGANTVLVEKSTAGFMGANMSGKAYLCS